MQALSNLSPYLHYGQLAPQRAAIEAAKHRAKYKVWWHPALPRPANQLLAQRACPPSATPHTQPLTTSPARLPPLHPISTRPPPSTSLFCCVPNPLPPPLPTSAPPPPPLGCPSQASVEGFLEELVVRRELSDNYCHYCPDNYDKLDAAYDWARDTLNVHASDRREHLYTRCVWEGGGEGHPARLFRHDDGLPMPCHLGGAWAAHARHE